MTIGDLHLGSPLVFGRLPNATFVHVFYVVMCHLVPVTRQPEDRQLNRLERELREEVHFETFRSSGTHFHSDVGVA